MTIHYALKAHSYCTHKYLKNMYRNREKCAEQSLQHKSYKFRKEGKPHPLVFTKVQKNIATSLGQARTLKIETILRFSPQDQA